MASTSPVELMMDSLKTKLWASAFYTSIGQRLAVDRIEADAALPCCVYSIGNLEIQRYMGGSERYECTVEFTIFASAKTTTDTLHSLAASLQSSLTGTYTISTLDRMTVTRLSGTAPSFEDESWSIVERYRMVSFKV